MNAYMHEKKREEVRRKHECSRFESTGRSIERVSVCNDRIRKRRGDAASGFSLLHGHLVDVACKRTTYKILGVSVCDIGNWNKSRTGIAQRPHKSAL